MLALDVRSLQITKAWNILHEIGDNNYKWKAKRNQPLLVSFVHSRNDVENDFTSWKQSDDGIKSECYAKILHLSALQVSILVEN